MKKHILLATCAITTVWASDADPITHEEWKKRVEGHQTPRRMAVDYDKYHNEFAKQNPSGVNQGPQANAVLQKFAARLDDPNLDLNTKTDVLSKAMDFQASHPDAFVDYSGKRFKLDEYDIGKVLKGYSEAYFSADTTTLEAAKLFIAGTELQTRYPNVRDDKRGEKFFTPGKASRVLEELERHFSRSQDPIEKAQSYMYAITIQEYFPQYGEQLFDENKKIQIYQAFQSKMRTLADPSEIIKLHEVWVKFYERFPCPDAVYKPTFEQWQNKYNQAVAALGGRGALVLSSDELQTAGGSAAAAASAGATVSTERSVQDILNRHDEMFPPSSLTQFKEDFTKLYRLKSPLLHPDRNQGDRAETAKLKMQKLQADYEWVSSLTEETFQAALR